MALKKLAELKKKEDFINKAAVDGKPRKGLQRADKYSKQTIALDKARYIKLKKYCAENKTSIQQFLIERIDEYFLKIKD